MIGRRNQEAYQDLTPYSAVADIESKLKKAREYRPLVYVCSPFAGDTAENVKNARRYCRFAVLQGYIPLAPHLLFPQFLNDNDAVEREMGLHFGNVLLAFCLEVWVFGKYISPVMETEIKRARLKARRIRYFTEDLEEVSK